MFTFRLSAKSSISTDDLLCSACKELLVRPVVLNCGHVYCEGCVVYMAQESEKIKCQECHVCDPRGFPKVCLVLEQLFEENFPEEYNSRRSGIQNRLAHNSKRSTSTLDNLFYREGTKQLLNYPETGFQLEEAPNGSGIMFMTASMLEGEPGRWWCRIGQDHKEGTSSSDENNNNDLPWSASPALNVHVGTSCDSCGVFPVVEDRYRCKDCKEEVGYDLCKDCYESPSKVSGRFNQQHTPDHRLELAEVPQILVNIDSNGFLLGRMVDEDESADDSDESEEESRSGS